MARFIRGNAVRLESDVTSGADDSAVTPSSISVSVYDPDGRAVVTNAAATLVSTGKYFYAYASAVTDPVGTWSYVYTATSGAYNGMERGTFDLYAVPA